MFTVTATYADTDADMWLWQVRAPMLPTHVFLIDVSYHAVTSGATTAACSAVAASLDCIQGTAHQAPQGLAFKCP